MRQVFRVAGIFIRECIAGSEQSSSAIQAAHVVVTLLAGAIGWSVVGWTEAFTDSVGPLARWLAAAAAVLICGGLRLAWRVTAMEEEAFHDFGIDGLEIQRGVLTSAGERTGWWSVGVKVNNRGARRMRFRLSEGLIHFGADCWHPVVGDDNWLEIEAQSPEAISLNPFVTPMGRAGQIWVQVEYTTVPPSRTHMARKCFAVDSSGQIFKVDWSKRIPRPPLVCTPSPPT